MHMMCSSNSQVVVAITLILAVTLAGQSAEAARAFFIFGDSLVDNGNNNYLATTARADMPPYGIDFPTHRATGRFSNGYNIPDLISQNLGAESTLAYLDPQLTGEKLLVGANFASAGIGILNDTGVQFANIIRIYQQLDYFSQYQQRVTELIGPEGAQSLVNGALSLIVLGGNDYVNNYFLNPPLTGRRFQMNLQDFSVLLITEYRKILQRLFDLGARRVLVTGTGPIGCVPAELASSGSQNGECSPEPMRAAEIFNPILIEMLQELNRDIGGDVFVAANANQMQHNFISNPEDFGFVNSKVACCGQGPYNGIGVCTVVSNLCQNREDYVFWDPFHPSEKANRIIVQTLFQGSQEYMTPMNLSTIMELDSKM